MPTRLLKDVLRERGALDTGISWVRTHIGITGNEAVDKEATYQSILAVSSILGEIAHANQAATEGGLYQTSKDTRKSFRAVAGCGLGTRTNWNSPPTQSGSVGVGGLSQSGRTD